MKQMEYEDLWDMPGDVDNSHKSPSFLLLKNLPLKAINEQNDDTPKISKIDQILKTTEETKEFLRKNLKIRNIMTIPLPRKNTDIKFKNITIQRYNSSRNIKNMIKTERRSKSLINSISLPKINKKDQSKTFRNTRNNFNTKFLCADIEKNEKSYSKITTKLKNLLNIKNPYRNKAIPTKTTMNFNKISFIDPVYKTRTLKDRQLKMFI